MKILYKSLISKALGRLRSNRLTVGMALLLFLAIPGISKADTDYLYYNSSGNISGEYDYRYDRIGETWESDLNHEDDWIAAEETPAEGDLVWGEHWSSTTYHYYPYAPSSYSGDIPYDIAVDSETGDSYLYVGWVGNYNWYLWADSGHYAYFVGSEYWRYDVITNSYAVDYYGYGNYRPLDGGPENPGYVLSSEDWTNINVGGTDYGYISSLNRWYIDVGYQESVTFNGVTTYIYNYASEPVEDPTADWEYIQIGSDTYSHDTETDDWFVQDGSDWDSTDDPMANWAYETIDEVVYAHDTVTNDWFVADGDDWDATTNPGAHWVSNTINETSYAYDTLTHDWFVADGTDWTSTSDPTTGWDLFTINSTDYAYDSGLDAWYVFSTGWSDTDYPITVGSAPETDYYYYSMLFLYDAVAVTWYDETLIDEESGFYAYCGSPYLFGNPNYDPGTLIGSDHWAYYTINGTDYAYDDYLDAWFYDTETQNEYTYDEIWAPTDNPLIVE